MSYIFRLHKEGTNTQTDWDVSTKMGSSVIEQIQDPNGENATREITSIPSPYARIDLVKTAFKKVADTGINGNSIHHKIVSDCLDIGQIFFDFEKFKDKFNIIVWNKTDDLNELINSRRHPGHKQLGDTYQTYLQQDGSVYNFDQMQRMYFLNYRHGPAEVNIIGATSPATLFFSSANDLQYVNKGIKFRGNQPFDGKFTPLYKRDFEYQKYWYALRGSVHNFAGLFPEVENYLVKNLEKSDQMEKDILNNIEGNDYPKYKLIEVSANQTISVLPSIELRRCDQDRDIARIAQESGFVIKSANLIDGKLPLVLPVDTYTHRTVYTGGDVWDQNTKAKYYNELPIRARTLPSVGTPYPYLTISDFLTDTIVRMPYEIDNGNFFDGNINKTNGESYLLPLTSTFFDFFSVKDLIGEVGNRKMFELEDKSTGVTAVLRIPIKSGYIEYRRTYFEGGVDVAQIKENKANDGALIDKKLGLGIMPLIRFPENVQKHYRIAMFDRGRNDIVLTCIDDKKAIETKQVIRSSKDLNLNICSNESYVVEDNFDRIQVKVGAVTDGYIIPHFKESQGGNTQYTFAVDFGTTNTHIEYCTSANPTNPVAFDITADERQLHRLHKAYTDDKDINGGFLQNFIPDTVGANGIYSFPMRTVFSQHKNVDYTKLPMPLADGNIPFLYEKGRIEDYNETKTDLKWGGIPDRLLEMYLETIFILMLNKVVLNGGDLPATKVIWFYPASMLSGRVNRFKLNWKNAYRRYFGDNCDSNVISISESTAPYNYYSKKQGGRTEFVSIDVGGGTTDVFVVEGQEPKMLLSFRFASNAVFGDGYNWDPNNNGFVNLYKNAFGEMLSNNRFQELREALNQIEVQKKSSDIVAFLFSLNGDNPSLNFFQQLSGNDRMRYVFIVFYAAILYFIAKSMKAKGLQKPLTLAFSGNGSHSLRIVSNEDNEIARFAKLIFDGVYADGDKRPLQVIMERENPKKATCKGGILSPVSQDYDTIENIKTILVGNDFNDFSDKKITYAEINAEIKQGVVESVKDFFNFLFKLHKDNNDFLIKKLAAAPAIYARVKEICLDETRLSQSLLGGLHHKQQEPEVTDETEVEETLFFYPLVGVLHDLALEISRMK